MRPRRALPILSLVLAAWSVGCAGTTSSPAPAGGGDADLRARLLELQRRAAVAESEIDYLRRRVAALEAQIGPAVAPQGAPAQPVERPVAPPRATPTLEESDLEQPPPAVAAPPGDAAVAAVRTLVPVSPAAQTLYDQGYTLYHQGRYLDAESAFQRFLQSYADTELADNAEYWIGESRLARGDVQGALAAFRETVERYPEGNKVPDALLKLGQCLEKLGDAAGARATYGEVMERFPDTAAAAIAQERAAELR